MVMGGAKSPTDIAEEPKVLAPESRAQIEAETTVVSECLLPLRLRVSLMLLITSIRPPVPAIGRQFVSVINTSLFGSSV